MHKTETPQKQRCHLVVQVFPDGLRMIVSDHEGLSAARKDALARAAECDSCVFVIYEPDEAYAAAPRVAERAYLTWPEPDAEPAPAPAPFAEEGVTP